MEAAVEAAGIRRRRGNHPEDWGGCLKSRARLAWGLKARGRA